MPQVTRVESPRVGRPPVFRFDPTLHHQGCARCGHGQGSLMELLWMSGETWCWEVCTAYLGPQLLSGDRLGEGRCWDLGGGDVQLASALRRPGPSGRERLGLPGLSSPKCFLGLDLCAPEGGCRLDLRKDVLATGEGLTGLRASAPGMT